MIKVYLFIFITNINFIYLRNLIFKTNKNLFFEDLILTNFIKFEVMPTRFFSQTKN